MTRRDTGEIAHVFTRYEALSPRLRPDKRFFTFRGKYTTSTVAMWLVGDYLRGRLQTSDDLQHNTFSSVAIMRHDPNTLDASSV